MRKRAIGLVLLLAAVVSAPQGYWWLFSDERHTMTAAQVEQAVRLRLELGNDRRWDRIECEPIVRPPGQAVCDVQEEGVQEDTIRGLIFEVKKNGDEAVYEIDFAEAPAKSL